MERGDRRSSSSMPSYGSVDDGSPRRRLSDFAHLLAREERALPSRCWVLHCKPKELCDETTSQCSTSDSYG